MQVPTGYFSRRPSNMGWDPGGRGAIMKPATYGRGIFPDLSASGTNKPLLIYWRAIVVSCWFFATLRASGFATPFTTQATNLNRPPGPVSPAQTAKSKIEICSKVRGGYRSALPEAHECRAADSGQCAGFSLSAKFARLFVKRWRAGKCALFSDVFQDLLLGPFKQREQAFQNCSWRVQGGRDIKSAQQPRAL